MKDILSKHLVSRKIDGFPYPEKFCPICEQPLNLIRVIHVSLHEEFYKAIYGCVNGDCLSYDAEARMSYARIYYSCNEALSILEGIGLTFTRKTADGEYFTDDH